MSMAASANVVGSEKLAPGRTEDVRNIKGIMFEDMGLKKELLIGIKEKGFYAPSPIQEEAIPIICTGADVLARAKNGTGKTASFLIPIINSINTSMPELQALVIVPTRELAAQTSQVCSELSKYLPIKCAAIFGGSSYSVDTSLLAEGVQILVSTPGRVLDFVQRGILKLGHVKQVAIDEADTVIATNHNNFIEKLMALLSPKCQLLLFSATFPRSISLFRDKYMKGVVEINLMQELTLKGITQFYAHTEEADKLSCLYTLLSKLKTNQAIVFCNSVRRAQLLSSKLIDIKFAVKCIHSKMPQPERLAIFDEFRRSNFRILVCTDLFNRGIDIQSVNVVINFDLPKTSATYLHRIGRSGRFGMIGLGISFVTNFDKDTFFQIMRELSTEINPVPKDIEISQDLYVSGAISTQQGRHGMNSRITRGSDQV